MEAEKVKKVPLTRKEINKRSYEKHRERRAAEDKIRYQKNKEKIREYQNSPERKLRRQEAQKAWRLANKERIVEYGKEYVQKTINKHRICANSLKYYYKNKEYYAEYYKKWKAQNPDYERDYYLKKKALK